MGIAAVMIILVLLGLAQAKVEIVENFHGTYAIHIYINETERPNAVGTGHFCAFDSEETYCCSNNHTQYAQWTASSQRALNNATGHNFTCPFEMWGEFEEMNTLVLIFFIVPMAMAVLVIIMGASKYGCDRQSDKQRKRALDIDDVEIALMLTQNLEI